MAIVLLGLLAGVMCEWDKSVPMFDSSVHILDYDVYHQEGGITHVVYCYDYNDAGTDTYGLGYIQFSDNEIIKQKLIETNPNCSDIKLTLLKNESILIVFSKARRNYVDQYGLEEIYIISAKIDEEWIPVPITRTDLSDAVDRNQQQIAVSANGDVHLFFVKKYSTSSAPRLSFSIKPSSNINFNSEIITYFPVTNRLIGAVTTTRGYTTTVHAFIEADNKTLHVYSNGSEEWSYNVVGDPTENYTKFIAESTEDVTAIVAILTKENRSYYKVSWDDGETWNQPIEFSDESHEFSTGTIVSKVEFFVLHALMGKNGSSSLISKYVILNSSMIVSDEGPFSDISEKEIKCANIFKDHESKRLVVVGNLKVREAYPAPYHTSTDLPSGVIDVIEAKKQPIESYAD